MAHYRSIVAVLLVPALCLAGGCRKKNKLKRSKDVPSVVVRSPDVGTGQPSQPEHEPNDTPAKAQVLSEVSRFRLIGSIEPTPTGQADVDYYRLAIPGEAPPVTDAAVDPREYAVQLSLTLGSYGPPLSLSVLDAAGTPLAAFACDPEKEATVPNLAVLPGHAYLLRVKEAKAAKSTKARRSAKTAPPDPVPTKPTGSGYFLAGELGQFGPGDEHEPNDTPATADPVRPFSGAIERAGFLSPTRDEDWYQIPLPSFPAVLGLAVMATKGTGVTLKVVDGRGDKLGMALGNRDSEVALRNVAIPVAPTEGAPEAVFAVVRTEAGQNSQERYVLHLTLGPAEAGMEVEPNNEPTHATAMEAGSIRGYLPRGDVDVFRYQPAAGPGQGLRVTVTPPSRIRLGIEVSRASDGLMLARQESKARGPLVVTIPAPLPEAVLLRIAPRRGQGNSNQPYAVAVDLLPATNPADSP
jgi:hypothetical protein